MKKSPTVFERCCPKRNLVSSIPNPACEWVFNGEGLATVKYDGTCVMWDLAQWWVRREVKPGQDAPEGFAKADYDPVTGKTMGWVPATESGFAKYLQEALTCPYDTNGDGDCGKYLCPYCGQKDPGTYELCGPKINGNPEGIEHHRLYNHSHATRLPLAKVSYEYIKEVFESPAGGIEGIVWHHPDGRYAKIKRRDYGLPWPIR